MTERRQQAIHAVSADDICATPQPMAEFSKNNNAVLSLTDDVQVGSPTVPPAADTMSTELPKNGLPSTRRPMLMEAVSMRSLMSCRGGLSGSPLSRWAVFLAAHLCRALKAASVSSPVADAVFTRCHLLSQYDVLRHVSC